MFMAQSCAARGTDNVVRVATEQVAQERTVIDLCRSQQFSIPKLNAHPNNHEAELATLGNFTRRWRRRLLVLEKGSDSH